MIYVECKPDKALINHLIGGDIEHLGNKSEVCKRLEKLKNSIGIIDEDPNSPKPHYLKKLQYIKEKDDLKLYKDNENNNKVILICPRLEEWILDIVRKEEINLKDHNFPDNPNEFHNIVNINITEFQLLINKIKKRKKQKIINVGRFYKIKILK